MDNLVALLVGALIVLTLGFVGLMEVFQKPSPGHGEGAGGEVDPDATHSAQPIQVVIIRWHALRTVGAWLFWVGVVVLIVAYFIPTAMPDASIGETGEYAYRKQLEAVQASIQLRTTAHFIGDKILTGGFLMWLAGRVIDALRHPKVY